MNRPQRSTSRVGDVLGLAIVVSMLLAILIGVTAYERMIWNECRATNSFWYCLHLLGR